MPAGAATGPGTLTSSAASERCLQAARLAAARTGVPLPVLQAIALTETGRRTKAGLQPWPWAVNVGGRGVWFRDRAAAVRFAAGVVRDGRRNLDIGCFQLNYRWHGGAFESLDAMFDPERNALYAARFLRRLFEERGSWQRAAGAYHSRTPALAQRYRARFAANLARTSAALRGPGGAGEAIRRNPQGTGQARRRGTTSRGENRYPLLTARFAATRSPASLVGVGQADGPLIAGAGARLY